ncbi:SCO2400 family protein [Streptomyces koelreuteriae]|uniref:SCO2400 family protein n=1 Tax=Streptomyces koelreuteriae TaxID=2838015 RepID=UPI003EBE6557
MDYCDPCRRHLNGALTCPGCGTSADALRRREREYGDQDDSGGVDADRDGDVYDDEEPLGRAARRRGDGPGGASRRDRKAAAHRRRRRRTLFIAAGFILAAGGLSLAELGMDAPKSTSKPAEAEGDPAEAGETIRPAGDKAGAEEAPKSPSPGTSDSPSASTSPKPKKSKPPEPTRPPTPETSPNRPTSAPMTPPPAPTRTAAPTTPTPTPEPSPTRTCNRFLWWCA